MTSVLDRDALDKSPLADLHLIANELGVDGFRRLRKAELVDAIIARQAGEDPPAARRRAEVAEATPAPRRRSRAKAAPEADGPGRRDRGRGRRPRRTAHRRGRSRPCASRAPRRPRSRAPRGRRRAGRDRGERDRGGDRTASAAASAAPRTVPSRASSSCSATARPSSGSAPTAETTDGDVYVSAAQVKRCELVTGDRDRRPDARAAPLRALPVARPRRHDQRRARPTRSPRARKFEDLPADLAERAPRARLRGRHAEGGRVADAVRQGLARGDLRRPARGQERAGARHRRGARRPRGARAARRAGRRAARGDRRLGRARAGRRVSFAASPDAQAQAVEQAVEQGRRVAARGGDAVVVIDTLEYVAPQLARRALGGRAQHRRRRLADRHRHRAAAVRRRDHRRRARRDADRAAALPGARPGGQRHAARRALVGDAGAEAIAKARAERRERVRELAAGVGDPAPVGLG